MRIKGRKILTGFTAVVICLLGTSRISGQASPKSGAVLIRNVRIVSDDNTPVSMTVLLSEKTVIRVDPNAPMPAGAIVIDDGGNLLTLDDDWTFRLSLGSLSSLSSPSGGVGSVEVISYFRLGRLKKLKTRQTRQIH